MAPSDRTVKVTLKGDISDWNRAVLQASAGAKAFSKELDSSTDRATNLTQSILAIGPALVPIGAAGVPIIAGLTNQLAFAATGAGVAALAFSGVGDALKATNDYAIEPTEANLVKMQQALSELGPAGRDFVAFLQELRPQLQGLQDAAQGGLFPGVEDGITEAMVLLPQFERIVSTVASSLGELIAEAGDNLNDPRWVEFFTFIENEARPTLLDMGRTLGNFAEGFANLWMAFDPLSDNFSASFLQMSRDFAAWTDGLSQTEGFQEFVDYITENGPRAWDALGAIGNALLQIVEAAAPVGSAALPVIEALADGIAAVADSDLGPIIIGVVSLTAALSRMKALGLAANSSALGGLFGGSAMGGGLSNIKAVTAASNELRVAQSKLADNPGMQQLSVYKENLKGVASAEKNLTAATKARNAQFRSAATGVGAMAFVMSDLDDKMGLTNTAMLAMAGSMAGPWGAGLGAGVGLVMDLASAGDDATDKIKGLIAQVNAAGALSGQERNDISVTGAMLVDDKDSLRASDELDAALDRNKRKAEDAAFAEAGLAKAMDEASDSTREQTFALVQNIAAHNRRADELLAESNAEIALEQAFDDATATIKENGRTLDINTQKGRENQAALNQIAERWNAMTPAAQSAKGALERTREMYIKNAIAAGKSTKEAERLAKALFDLPAAVSVDVKARGAAKSKADIDAIKASLDRLKSKDIVIRTFRETYGKEAGGSRERGAPHKADGGQIRGPGGPRSDSIPIWVSDEEFVVNAAATRQNLGLLHAINNSRRFADGGQVGRVQRMADGGSVRSSAIGPLSLGPFVAELAGAEIEVAADGLMRFVKGQIRIAAQDTAQDVRFG